jgi:hypothetical protein
MVPMKCKTGVYRAALVAGLMVQGVVAADSRDIESPRGRVYGMIERIERIEYTESDPVRAAFDWGRLAATRWLAGFGIEPDAFWYGGGIVGLGVNEAHSGEGQTVEYDAVILGMEGAYRCPLPMLPGMGCVASARYLIGLPDNGSVTYVARDTRTDGGVTELSWNELTLGVAATLDYDTLRFEAGLEYCARDIRQEWTFPDNRTSSDSTLNPDRDLGIRVGGAWPAGDLLEVRLEMTMGHQTAFRGGVQYVF